MPKIFQEQEREGLLFRTLRNLGPLFPTRANAIRQEVVPHIPQGLHEVHQGLPREEQPRAC